MISTRIHRPDDPAYVASQYATERGLAARAAVYSNITGRDAREVGGEPDLDRRARLRHDIRLARDDEEVEEGLVVNRPGACW